MGFGLGILQVGTVNARNLAYGTIPTASARIGSINANRTYGNLGSSVNVGVISPSQIFPNDVGKNWATGASVEADIRAMAYCGHGIVIVGSAVGAGGKLYRSVDYGLTWTIVLALPYITNIVYCGDGKVVLNEGNTNKMYTSTDYGLTWTAGPVVDFMDSMVYVGNGIVLAGSWGNYIYRSTNYGVTWDAGQIVGSGNDRDFTYMVYCGNGIVLAGDYNVGRIYRSLNYGATWDAGRNVGYGVLGLAYCGNGIVVLGDYFGYIFRSTDYGNTWDAGRYTANMWSISPVVYLGNGVVIAGDNGHGYIHRSTDYGNTWDAGTAVGNYFIGTSIIYCGNGLALAAAQNGTIYRATTAFELEETGGLVPISGNSITYGTIPTASARLGSVSGAKVNYGTITAKRNTIVQDGTAALAIGSRWTAFPLAFSAAPRAVMLIPTAGQGGTINARVVRINAGSFAARCIQGSKTFYFSAKGSR